MYLAIDRKECDLTNNAYSSSFLQILGEDKILAITCTLDDSKKSCNDKEKAYIEKIQAWDAARVTQELARVRQLLETSRDNVKEDLVEWMKRRKNLLEQKQQPASAENEGTAEL